MDSLSKRIEECFNKISFVLPSDIKENDFLLREVMSWFKEIKGINILDVGCAKGRFVKTLYEKGTIISGIDITKNFIIMAKKKVPRANLVSANAIEIPFKNNFFDGILCIEVIEHIPDTEKVIIEMLRVLKPGGKIIIIDKNIFSLHFKYLIPTWLYKRIQEKRGKWMYPDNFPFKEKYFSYSEINKILKKYCSVVDSKFLTHGRSRRTNIIYRCLPFISYDIAWRGIK